MQFETEQPSERLCTLVYHPNEDSASQGEAEAVWLIARWEKSQRLSLFVNPAWSQFVLTEHREYLEELLEDFKERYRFEPEELFRQLCSLGVGPIIARNVNLMDSDAANKLPSEFLKLI